MADIDPIARDARTDETVGVRRTGLARSRHLRVVPHEPVPLAHDDAVVSVEPLVDDADLPQRTERRIPSSMWFGICVVVACVVLVVYENVVGFG